MFTACSAQPKWPKKLTTLNCGTQISLFWVPVESFHVPYGVNPVSETFHPDLNTFLGETEFLSFLDFCGIKMVGFKGLNVSTLFAIGSWNSKISPSVSTLKYLPAPRLCFSSFTSLLLLFSLLMFPPALCGKNPHVCLISEEVDLSNTHRAEMIWSDSSRTTALTRSHLYSQEMATLN